MHAHNNQHHLSFFSQAKTSRHLLSIPSWWHQFLLQFTSLHLHALMQQTTAIKPPHPLLSPSRKHQRRSIPSPPLPPSDGHPSSSPFPHGCSSKSLSFFSNKMEPHDQSEYVMPLVLSSRHESNNWWDFLLVVHLLYIPLLISSNHRTSRNSSW
jgi:hypothetical protein